MYCGKEYFLTTWCDVFTKEEYAKSVKDDMREHWNTLGAEEKNRYSNDFEQYTHASIDDWIKNDPDVRREIIDFGLWIDDEDAELDTEQASWFDCLEDALLAAWDAIDGGADADNVCIMAFTRSNGECWWNFPIEFNSLGTAFTDHDIYHLVADREDEAEIRERKKELA